VPVLKVSLPCQNEQNGYAESMLSLHELKLGILRSFARKQQHINKYNLLGKSPAQGELESNLQVTFDAEQRWLALQAFDELKAAGYIRPTLIDLVSPRGLV
jgi:hypothetical protein